MDKRFTKGDNHRTGVAQAGPAGPDAAPGATAGGLTPPGPTIDAGVGSPRSAALRIRCREVDLEGAEPLTVDFALSRWMLREEDCWTRLAPVS